MANWKSITSIPIKLEASSEIELMRLMLQNNLINQKRYNYFEPKQKNDGKWIVWFVDDVQEYRSNAKGEQLDLMPKLEGES